MYRTGPIEQYLADAASNKPAPGGGSVSALAGALGASMACMAASAMLGLRVRMASISGSAMSLSWMLASVPAMSRTPVVATLKRSTSPWKVSSRPSQRSSRPMLPSSWMTHRALLRPAALNCSPAPWPATNSVWPTWVIAPNSLYTSTPELMVMTGMPASTAFLTASFMASGLARETMIPSTLSAT